MGHPSPTSRPGSAPESPLKWTHPNPPELAHLDMEWGSGGVVLLSSSDQYGTQDQAVLQSLRAGCPTSEDNVDI